MLLPLGKVETPQHVRSCTRSFGLLFSVVAAAFTAAGMTSSFVSAMWAAASVLSLSVGSPVFSVLVYALPCYFGSGVAVTTMLHIVEKIGVAGGAEGVLGKAAADVVVGALAGVSTLLCVGNLAPWIALVLGKHTKRVWYVLPLSRDCPAIVPRLSCRVFLALAFFHNALLLRTYSMLAECWSARPSSRPCSRPRTG